MVGLSLEQLRLGFESRVLRLQFEPQGCNLSLKAGILVSRLVYESQSWVVGFKGGFVS